MHCKSLKRKKIHVRLSPLLSAPPPHHTQTELAPPHFKIGRADPAINACFDALLDDLPRCAKNYKAKLI